MPLWTQMVIAIGAAIGLSMATRSLYEAQHLFLPLVSIYQLATAGWAAWDSNRIELRKYKSIVSFHPIMVFVLVGLVWIVFFPAYLYAKNRIKTGKAKLKSDNLASGGKSVSPAYILRLGGFALACLVAGAGILFCIFAPRINPSFINSYLFRTDIDELGKPGYLMMASPSDARRIKQISADLKKPFDNVTFKRLGVPAPEIVHFNTRDGVTLDGYYFADKTASYTVLLSTDGYLGQRFAVLMGYIKLLLDCDYSVLIYDYRQFSNGHSDTDNCIADGRAAYDFLTREKKVDPQHVILMGDGIGAYVCCQLMKDVPVAGAVLENPWTTLKANIDSSRAAAMRVIPLALYPKDGLDNMVVLKQKHPPVLIAASSLRDPEPFEIYDAIPGPKSFIKISEMESFKFPDIEASEKRYVPKLKTFLNAKEEPAQAAQTQGDARELTWSNDLEKTLSQAKQEHKLVLVDFYTDWCHWCKVMDQKTYTDGSVRKSLNAHYLCAKVDCEDARAGKALARKYEVQAYPTIVILDGDGRVVDRATGFISARPLHMELEALSK